MRICLISREYPPETGWGGIATYTYHQAHALKELGHDVEVIALAPAGASEHDLAPLDQDGVIVNRVACDAPVKMDMIKASIPFTHYVLSALLALSRKFDEIQANKPFDVAESPEHLAEGLCPALMKSVPLVVRLHTPQSKLIAEQFHNLRSSFDQEFVALIERIAMLHADEITSPSLDMAKYVSADVGIPFDQIKVIRNQIDEKRFRPDGPRALAADDRLNVLTVGRLEPRKGVIHLVNAVPLIIKEFPQVRFVIIGGDTKNASGQTSTLAELQAKLADLGCQEYVNFIPHVELEKIPDFYRCADVFVIPSLYDNAPMTCLEAMACGRAIVATDAGGTKEYATDEECGLIVPAADAGAISQAVLRLLKDDSERARLGNNARTRVEKELTRTNIARQTLPVYESAIARFASAKGNALYRRGAFMPDVEALLSSYDTMLYNFLYQQSSTFRLKHRLKKLSRKISI